MNKWVVPPYSAWSPSTKCQMWLVLGLFTAGLVVAAAISETLKGARKVLKI